MKKTKVYDLPTRLFHWLFAALFLGAFFIAKVIDDDSPTYAYHMLLGLVLALTVILRVVWGWVGSRYARFSSFALKPSDLIQYLKQLVTGKSTRRLGHNPASSWAAILMMTLALGLALTGYFMTSGGDKETLEEVHELLANAFIIVVMAHVVGIILHTLKHRDWIGLSMVNGKKQSIEGEAGIERSHRGVALLFLVIVGAFVIHLNQNYDTKTQSLIFFGSALQLGESEEKESSGDGEDNDEDNDKD